MDREIRSTDAKGRVCLPNAFANANVIIDQVSDTEVRIREAVVIPHDEIRFSEETPIVLSDRDRDALLAPLDHPPEPNPALRKLMAGTSKKHV